jgi:hypothetical protein
MEIVKRLIGPQDFDEKEKRKQAAHHPDGGFYYFPPCFEHI